MKRNPNLNLNILNNQGFNIFGRIFSNKIIWVLLLLEANVRHF